MALTWAADLQACPQEELLYLAQKRPAAQPELFAPGILNTGMVTRLIGGYWSEPVPVPLHDDPEFCVLELRMAGDGESVMFLSNKAAPGETQQPRFGTQNIFHSRRGDEFEDWSAAEPTFDGDLEAALQWPVSKARSAMKKFPGIANPGADKILLFTRTHALPAFESNGLRSLIRTGFVEEAKDYSATYRAATKAFAPYAEKGCAWLIRAHQLLRVHGQALCKNNDPHCEECCLAASCPCAS